MNKILILGATLVNEGQRRVADLLVEDGRIARIDGDLSALSADKVIEAEGLFLLPGMIDDQVHFREPGLTYKAEIATESRAAVAGGITSTMEMPNCNPATTNHDALRAKLARGAEVSATNYGFYFGATNDNLEEVKSLPLELACGVKVFMGSSTGNMLVDEPAVLKGIFSSTPILIATHCEDTPSINALEKEYIEKYGHDIPAHLHPEVRSAEACHLSSTLAVGLAKEHGARLHVLHLTTERELALFEKGPMENKAITAEVCVHHLWYSEEDYHRLGHQIKCNPAIKKRSDRDALRRALADDILDIVATDHAPHTWEEKHNPYTTASSGLPLVQHALQTLLELVNEGTLDLEKAVTKCAHNPAIRYQVKERGFLREGYWADLVLVDPSKSHTVTKDELEYKCGWAPNEGQTYGNSIHTTIVSGQVAYESGRVVGGTLGEALEYHRPNL